LSEIANPTYHTVYILHHGPLLVLLTWQYMCYH
jgi:hypothetical protein